MSQQNKKNSDKRTDKKAAVLGTEKKNPSFLIIFACVAIVTASIVFYKIKSKNNTNTYSASAQPTSNQVMYPVNIFDDGKAKHFEYRLNNTTIKYFIIKSSDGVIRAAFDACDVCWPEGKGYYQEGDYMVCRNCGRRFESVLVNEVKGGCNPAPLKRKVENGQLIIQVKDILEGNQYFNFQGKV